MKEPITVLTQSQLELLIIDCVTAVFEAQGNARVKSEVTTKYVTPKEAAKLANCTRRKIDMMAANGSIRRHKMGARTQYLRSEVLALIEPVQAA